MLLNRYMYNYTPKLSIEINYKTFGENRTNFTVSINNNNSNIYEM